DIKQRIYTRALEKMKSAKLASDYRAARDEFGRIAGYLDANDLAKECDQYRINIEKTFIRKRIIVSSLSVLVLILVIVGASSSSTKYYFANLAQLTNAYSTAINSYKKLGDFKDSEERLRECQYQNGLALAKEGKYKEARKAFEAA